jgi:hypothetical protein
MLKDILLGFLPTIFGSIAAVYMENKLRSNFARRKNKNSKHINFLKFTHWINLNKLKLFMLQAVAMMLHIFYMLYNKRFPELKLPNITVGALLTSFVVSAVIILLTAIDILFNTKSKLTSK